MSFDHNLSEEVWRKLQDNTKTLMLHAMEDARNVERSRCLDIIRLHRRLTGSLSTEEILAMIETGISDH